jgi:hypothetical protein
MISADGELNIRAPRTGLYQEFVAMSVGSLSASRVAYSNLSMAAADGGRQRNIPLLPQHQGAEGFWG